MKNFILKICLNLEFKLLKVDAHLARLRGDWRASAQFEREALQRSNDLFIINLNRRTTP